MTPPDGPFGSPASVYTGSARPAVAGPAGVPGDRCRLVPGRPPEAAESLGITAARLKQLGLIDKVVAEPLGGAHRDAPAMMIALKKALTEALRQASEPTVDALLETREEKILAYGRFKEIPAG